MILKINHYTDLLQRYNPFGLREDKNHSRFFIDYEGAYVYALVYLYERFPNGYIDLVLFFIDNLCVSRSEAERYAKLLKGLNMYEGIYSIQAIGNKDKLKQSFKDLFKALHQLSDSQFDEEKFNAAWQHFENHYKHQFI